jgi:hypothetical protein
MPLRSGDEPNLRSRGIIGAFGKNQTNFIEIAKISFQALSEALKALGRPPPDRDGMEGPLAVVLASTRLFRTVMRKYDPFTAEGSQEFVDLSEALARYMLHYHWDDITS